MHKEQAMVILTPGFPAGVADTACLPAQHYFVKTLKKTHPSINVIVLSFQYPYVRTAYDFHGARVYAFNGRNRGRLQRLKLWIRVWNQLHALHRKFHIIGILSFWLGETALIAKWFGRKKKIQYATWLMGQDAHRGNKYAYLVHPRAGHLIALSDFIAAAYQRHYRVRPAHVIPLGIDPNIYGAQPAPRTIHILGAGSLIPLKQFDVFIRVVHDVAKKIPGINAMLCGDGPEKEMLQRMILQLGLENQVWMAGELPHAELISLMQQAKVLLHPSSYEGMGMVCLEALGAGTQVVSFSKPMNEEIPGWHTVADEREMEKKVIALLHDPRENNPVIPFPMEQSVHRIMQLFPH